MSLGAPAEIDPLMPPALAAPTAAPETVRILIRRMPRLKRASAGMRPRLLSARCIDRESAHLPLGYLIRRAEELVEARLGTWAQEISES
jgi:hypothetical protein